MKHLIIFSLAFFSFCTYAWAQTENLDPQNKSRWQVVNRNAYMSEPGRVELNAADNDGLMILSTSSFQNGTIKPRTDLSTNTANPVEWILQVDSINCRSHEARISRP